MEFRCPACDTSYRVPVSVGQQVRCARCNHVWRISESDFVSAPGDPDAGEMPDEFAQVTSDGDAAEDASFAQVRETLSSLLDHQEEWPDEAGEARRSDDPVQPDQDWPGGVWSDAGRREAEDVGAPDDDPDAPAASEAHSALGLYAQSESQGDAFGDEEDDISPQQRIADDWFGGATREEDHDDGHAGQADQAASFERIMEGIEEVIAESGQTVHALREDANPTARDDADPLRPLIGGARAEHVSAEARDAGPRENLRAGKVVQFAALRGDLRTGAPDRSEDGGAMDAAESRAEAVSAAASPEQMSQLLDQLAAQQDERAGVRDGDDLDAPDAAAPTDERADDGYAQEDAINPFAADRSALDPSYYDEGHEADQRESLAFAQDRTAFDEDTQAHEDDGQPDEWTDAEDYDAAELMPEASEAAGHDTFDDDRDGAAFGFAGPGEPEDADGPEIPAQAARSGTGFLALAAAWSLFLAILAGAGFAAIGMRERVSEALPAAAPLYAAIGFPVGRAALTFEDVRYTIEGNAAGVLTLNGRIRNVGDKLIEMPDLRIRVRDGDDATILEDSRFLGQAALLPGETMDFSVDLDVPADRLRTVELRF